jgi:hypothetical protein
MTTQELLPVLGSTTYHRPVAGSTKYNMSSIGYSDRDSRQVRLQACVETMDTATIQQVIVTNQATQYGDCGA